MGCDILYDGILPLFVQRYRLHKTIDTTEKRVKPD